MMSQNQPLYLMLLYRLLDFNKYQYSFIINFVCYSYMSEYSFSSQVQIQEQSQTTDSKNSKRQENSQKRQSYRLEELKKKILKNKKVKKFLNTSQQKLELRLNPTGYQIRISKYISIQMVPLDQTQKNLNVLKQKLQIYEKLNYRSIPKIYQNLVTQLEQKQIKQYYLFLKTQNFGQPIMQMLLNQQYKNKQIINHFIQIAQTIKYVYSKQLSYSNLTIKNIYILQNQIKIFCYQIISNTLIEQFKIPRTVVDHSSGIFHFRTLIEQIKNYQNNFANIFDQTNQKSQKNSRSIYQKIQTIIKICQIKNKNFEPSFTQIIKYLHNIDNMLQKTQIRLKQSRQQMLGQFHQIKKNIAFAVIQNSIRCQNVQFLKSVYKKICQNEVNDTDFNIKYNQNSYQHNIQIIQNLFNLEQKAFILYLSTQSPNQNVTHIQFINKIISLWRDRPQPLIRQYLLIVADFTQANDLIQQVKRSQLPSISIMALNQQDTTQNHMFSYNLALKIMNKGELIQQYNSFSAYSVVIYFIRNNLYFQQNWKNEIQLNYQQNQIRQVNELKEIIRIFKQEERGITYEGQYNSIQFQCVGKGIYIIHNQEYYEGQIEKIKTQMHQFYKSYVPLQQIVFFTQKTTLLNFTIIVSQALKNSLPSNQNLVNDLFSQKFAQNTWFQKFNNNKYQVLPKNKQYIETFQTYDNNQNNIYQIKCFKAQKKQQADKFQKVMCKIKQLSGNYPYFTKIQNYTTFKTKKQNQQYYVLIQASLLSPKNYLSNYIIFEFNDDFNRLLQCLIQIISSLKILHNNNIDNIDLKTSNIAIKTNQHQNNVLIQITNFFSLNQINVFPKQIKDNINQVNRNQVNTNNQKIDLVAFGNIIIDFMTKRKKIIKKKNEKKNLKLKLKNYYHSKLYNLIKFCNSVKATAQEILFYLKNLQFQHKVDVQETDQSQKKISLLVIKKQNKCNIHQKLLMKIGKKKRLEEIACQKKKNQQKILNYLNKKQTTIMLYISEDFDVKQVIEYINKWIKSQQKHKRNQCSKLLIIFNNFLQIQILKNLYQNYDIILLSRKQNIVSSEFVLNVCKAFYKQSYFFNKLDKLQGAQYLKYFSIKSLKKQKINKQVKQDDFYHHYLQEYMLSNEYLTMNKIKYQLQQFIGKGSDGYVYCALNLESNQKSAIKMILINKNSQNYHKKLKQAQREIRIMKKLNHPNIIKVYNSDKLEDSVAILVLIQMQLAQTNLLKYIKDRKYISENQAIHYAFQLSKALQQIHNCKIIHLDLCLQNILMIGQTLKISDFSISMEFKQKQQYIQKLDQIYGHHITPERQSGIVGYCVDVWTFGNLIYQIAKNQFINYRYSYSIIKIIKSKIDYKIQCGNKLYEVIDKCLIMDHKQRPKIDEVCSELECLSKTIVKQQSKVQKQQQLLDPLSTIEKIYEKTIQFYQNELKILRQIKKKYEQNKHIQQMEQIIKKFKFSQLINSNLNHLITKFDNKYFRQLSQINRNKDILQKLNCYYKYLDQIKQVNKIQSKIKIKQIQELAQQKHNQFINNLDQNQNQITICKTLWCNQNPFICKNQCCKCHQNHKNCVKILFSDLNNFLQSKLIKNVSYDKISKLYLELINNIVQKYKYFEYSCQNVGLTSLQKNVYLKIKNKDFSKITGNQINQIYTQLNNMEVQQIQNLQSYLQFITRISKQYNNQTKKQKFSEKQNKKNVDKTLKKKEINTQTLSKYNKQSNKSIQKIINDTSQVNNKFFQTYFKFPQNSIQITQFNNQNQINLNNIFDNIKQFKFNINSLTQTQIRLMSNFTKVQTYQIQCEQPIKETDMNLFINNCSNTKKLSLCRNKVTNRAIQQICKLKYLTILILDSDNIGNIQAQQISRIENLTTLSLNYNNVADAGIKYLSSLKKLNVLKLNHNKISEIGISFIHQFTNLKQLGIACNKFQLRVIKKLSTLTNLQSIDLIEKNGQVIQINNRNQQAANIWSINSLTLTSINLNSKQLIQIIHIFPQLISLNIQSNNIQNQACKAIASQLKSLLILDISYNKIDTDGLLYLSKLQNLHTLNITKNKITHQALQQILKIKSLTQLTIFDRSIKIGSHFCIQQIIYLDFSNIDIDDVEINMICKNFRKIQNLNLQRTKITSIHKSGLCLLSDLRILNLSFNKLCLSEINTLQNFSNLQQLYLNSIQLKDQNIQFISKLKNIITLQLSKNKIGPKGAKFISKLNKLQQLNLQQNDICDNGAQIISSLKSLTKLNLCSNQINEQGMNYIMKLHNLTWLKIDHNKIKAVAMIQFSRLKNLTYLSLNYNQIGIKTLKQILILTNLLQLQLQKCSLNKESMNELAKMVNIKKIHLKQKQIKSGPNQKINQLPNILTIKINKQSLKQIGRQQKQIKKQKHPKVQKKTKTYPK